MNEIVYKDIFEVFQFLQSKGWTINWYTPPHFQAMNIYDNRYAFVPMPMNPLFRGQSAYFDPSYPSIFRKERTMIEMLESNLLKNDFESILNSHPEIRELRETNMQVNYHGLAQHYGLDTEMMDLTNSALVAAFFATTDYDPGTDRYYPILDGIRKGVLYFLPLGCMANSFSGQNSIWPVGLEALRRPGEQRAYSIGLQKDMNFNNVCPLKFFFWQTPRVSVRIYEMTNFGKSLFPYDPMTEKIRMMKKLKIFSFSSFDKAFGSMNAGMTRKETIAFLNSHGITVQKESPFHYTKEELEYLNSEYRKKFSET